MHPNLRFNDQMQQNFISLSRELIHMTAVERDEFLRDTPDFPNTEKILVINTFMNLLEQQEDYETCAGLFELKKELDQSHLKGDHYGLSITN